MAMTAMHNTGAQLSLAHMNNNNDHAGHSLARLSSGQKGLGAKGDDAASFAISQKMLEQIRSLFQDDQNIQNGSTMLKVAERGINQIVQNLTRLKELAINAANDSNSDDDRKTIQKEFDSVTSTINDIALGTQYNGKFLLDGRWSRGGDAPLTGGGGGKNTRVQNILGSFTAAYNATASNALKNGARTGSAWAFDAEVGFQAKTYSSRYGAYLDFSAMTTVDPYPETLHNQGFTILCTGCMQYINIRFDADKSATESKYDPSPNTADDGTTNNLAREYIIGVKDVQSAGDLAEAIFKGISSTKGGSNTSAQIDSNHDLRIERDSSDPSKIIISRQAGTNLLFKSGTIPNPKPDEIGDAEIDLKPWNPLRIHHGIQANQRFNVYINSMQLKDLGLANTKVTTRENATAAIAVVEGALETALDEATTLGGWLQRLEYAGSNVTRMSENVQNAESVIRDVDMAKEMTEYTKYNILAQSSQAMLANANQDGSSILGLLQ